MDYFIDVTIRPDAEMRENVLLNKVYTKLHKALFLIKSTGIGVSFPNYNVTLGRVLRIHGSQSQLAKLQETLWLGGLSGYCDVTEARLVPSGCQYRTVSRKQATMSLAKLRRLMNRGSITPQETKAYKAKMFDQGLDNPYLELESVSNGHMHRRYLEFSKLSEDKVSGDFDYFGLSRIATVPWF